MNLRELLVKVKLAVNNEQMEKLNTGLKQARENVTRLGASSEQLERLNTGVQRLYRGLDLVIGYKILSGFANLTEKFAAMGQELDNMAQAAGVTAQQYQAMSYAASQTGVSQGVMSHSLMHLSRSLYEAKMGSKDALLMFSNLGFSGEDLARMHDGNDAMLALSKRVSGLHDPMMREALVMKALGRGSLEMVNILSRGPGYIQDKMGEAFRDGLVLNNRQIADLERINRSLDRLKRFLEVIGSYFAEELAPVVEHVVNDFIKIYNANKDWIDLNVQTFLGDLAYAMGFLIGLTGGLAERFERTFGKAPWTKHILETVTVIGALAAALTAIATLVGGAAFIARFSGLASMFSLLGKGLGGAFRGIGGLLGGMGEAGGAATVGAGAAEAGEATALIGGGGIMATLVGTVLPLAITAIAAYGIGTLIENLFGDKIGNMAWKLFGTTDQEALAKGETAGKAGYLHSRAHMLYLQSHPAAAGGNITQNITHNVSVTAHTTASANEIADTVTKHIQDHHARVMRETHRAVRGVKVGT